MVEPESMTVRRKGRVYMIPKPTMEQPKIYRGRGRNLRIERERKDFSHKYESYIWSVLETNMI